VSTSRKPGRHAGERGLPVLDPLEVGHRLVDELVQRGDLVLLAVPSHVVDPLLGLVGDPLGFLGRRVGHIHDVGRRADQPAQQRGLGDDPGVGRGGRRRRDPVDKVGDREVPAHLLEGPAALELLHRGDRVDGIAAAVDLAQGVEDLRVRAPIEVGGTHDLDDVGDRVGREHHRSEHGFLGLEVLRGHPLRPGLRPDPPDVVRSPHQPCSPLELRWNRRATLDPWSLRSQRKTRGETRSAGRA
jgi:hypothetical protein